MTEINKFQCDKCFHLHHSVEMALECESKHIGIENCKLTWVGNYRQKLEYGIGTLPPIPTSIQISFSDRIGDVAKYKLDYYGFKSS